MSKVTQLLKRLGSGDKAALDEIIPLVYQELRQIARGYLGHEPAAHTLQPTALIHEAYLRMVQQSHPNYSSRAHFYGVSARIMRQVLVDHARQRQAKKRGPGRDIPFSETLQPSSGSPINIVALDEALRPAFFHRQPQVRLGGDALFWRYDCRRDCRMRKHSRAHSSTRATYRPSLAS